MSIITTDSNQKLRKIPFYNASSYYILKDGGKCHLQLDINKDHIIKGVAFNLSDELDGFWVELFQRLPKLISDKSLMDISSLSWNDFLSVKGFSSSIPFFNLPIILLNDAVSRFIGLAPSFSESVNQNENDLLCRCFGVYKSESLSFFSKYKTGVSEEIFKNFFSTSKASLGCGACKSDFKKVYEQFGKSETGGCFIYPNNLSQSEFVVFADEFISSWLSKRKKSSSRVEIMDLYQGQIYCKMDLDELTIYRLSAAFKKEFNMEIIQCFLQ